MTLQELQKQVLELPTSDPCGICEAARIRTEKQDPPQRKKVKLK
jgi:hypothetical protein